MIQSISDKSSYREVCRAAATNDGVFKVFKRLPAYNEILEHVSREQGDGYLKEINRIMGTFEVLPINYFLTKFLTNDEIGSPNSFFYLDLETSISPTTLRYIKVAYEIWALFGSLDNKHIVEIGGGYGGQCKIIHDLFTPSSYTIIDMSEPLMLIDRCLKYHNVSNINLIDGTNLSSINSDLLISNYAFSECHGNIQKEYMEKVISKSKNGYMILNKIDDDMRPYSYDELAMILSGRLFPEIPLTHPNNKLLVW